MCLSKNIVGFASKVELMHNAKKTVKKDKIEIVHEDFFKLQKELFQRKALNFIVDLGEFEDDLDDCYHLLIWNSKDAYFSYAPLEKGEDLGTYRGIKIMELSMGMKFLIYHRLAKIAEAFVKGKAKVKIGENDCEIISL